MLGLFKKRKRVHELTPEQIPPPPQPIKTLQKPSFKSFLRNKSEAFKNEGVCVEFNEEVRRVSKEMVKAAGEGKFEVTVFTAQKFDTDIALYFINKGFHVEHRPKNGDWSTLICWY